VEKVVKKYTVYSEEDLHRALKIKPAETEYSLSDLVNDAVRQTLREDLEDLAANPRPSGTEKMAGREFYRFRQGDDRVVYSVDGQEKAVVIEKMGHRKRVYRGGAHEE